MSEDRIKALEEAVKEHDGKFLNGMHVMAALKKQDLDASDRISKVEAKVEPKPTNWGTLLMMAFTIVCVAMGAQWLISDRLADRPRWDQVDAIVGPLSADQDKMRDTVQSIDSSQRAQAQSIKAIEKAQEAQGKKLDEALKERRRR